jgi:hypothetical protein
MNARSASSKTAQLDSPLTDSVERLVLRTIRSFGTLQNKLSAVSIRFERGNYFRKIARLYRSKPQNTIDLKLKEFYQELLSLNSSQVSENTSISFDSNEIRSSLANRFVLSSLYTLTVNAVVYWVESVAKGRSAAPPERL